MRKLSIIFVAFLLSAWLAMPASAQVVGGIMHTEQTALSKTDATTDQTTAVINKPAGATGIVVILDVTAGSSLLMDLDIYGYSAGLADKYLLDNQCPSAQGITGISTTVCLYTNAIPVTNAYAANITDYVMHLPNYIQFVVDVGNTNAATYDLYYQWLW